ncbi:MAG: nucleoside hydrolase [Victivallales bacterium]|nr:nucleoside hydrolase [Victivallales bacterium]
MKKVILDTDLGTDIDDSWALGMLLNSEGLDTRLVLTATADTAYRGAVAAKHLIEFGRTDVEVGLGPAFDDERHLLSLMKWLDGFTVDQYPGKLRRDGVQRMIEIVEAEDEVTIIAIAALTNIGEFCRLRPDLVKKCHLVSMAGSLRKGHFDAPGKVEEWNVLCDIPAARTVFSAGWKSIILTPLDHCGALQLTGDTYLRFKNSETPIAKSIMEAYRSWKQNCHFAASDPEIESSILFDTAAVHLAVTREDSIIESHRILVSDEGFILENQPDGYPVDFAVDWTDKQAYLEHLTDVLLK